MIHTPFKSLVFLILALLPSALKAQHYYHDIMGIRETNAQMERMVRTGIRSISATGFDQDNRPQAGYTESQTIDPVRHSWVTRRQQGDLATWETLQFDAGNRLIWSVDSTATTINRTSYQYDEGGRITRIENMASDTAMGITEKELHAWFYDGEGKPLRMLRVVNDRDTTEFRLSNDEQGNPAEETAYRSGKAGETTYYYYNEKALLTDIVRYNTKAGRLLPDFMFEYDEAGRVIQKITVMPNPKIGYLIWRYQYNEKGLKVREANFTREKKLIGRIDYSYMD